jgi:RHS repeat-associated protein
MLEDNMKLEIHPVGNPEFPRFIIANDREWDAWTANKGVQYNRARYYDPHTGRWMSQDPLGFGAGDTNLQRYVRNGPSLVEDPSGLDDTARGTDAQLTVELRRRQELLIGRSRRLRHWPRRFKVRTHTTCFVSALTSVWESETQRGGICYSHNLRRVSSLEALTKPRFACTKFQFQEVLSEPLSETSITDVGLKEVSGLPKLEQLEINRTRVTDAGLRWLTKLDTIKVPHPVQ